MFEVSLYLASLAGAWFMTGLIWLIQIVHYPLMAQVGAAHFPRYHALHSARITFIVAPVMGIELLTAAALLVFRPEWCPAPVAIASLILAVGVWGVTFLHSVPCHNKLAQGYDAALLRRLIAGNALRTMLWTSRALLLIYPLAPSLE